MRFPGFVGRAAAWVSRKSSSMTTLDLYRQMVASAASRAGVTVTHKTALEVAVVFACARAIAEGMSSIPFRLMKANGRNRLPATDHPLVDLMGTAPNEYQTPVDFFDQIGLHLVLCGNAYVWANRDRKDTPIELLPLEPGKVRPDKAKNVYTVMIDAGRTIDVPASEIWHIRGPSWDGWMGLDGVKMAREAIGLSIAQEQHGAATFANGASIAGILTTDASLNPEQRRQLRDSWDQTHGGLVNAGKVAVMSHGMKFIAVASTNSDAQWHEGRAAQIEELCRFFRVLPIIIGHADKTSTYASAEAFFDAHVRLTMLPWYRRVEKSADRWLLTDRDRKDGLYWKFFPAGLLRANSKDRGEFYRALYGVGAINPNEIREFEDMNPYPGGDAYRVPLNMADPTAPPPPAGA